METQICSVCKKSKPFEQFHKNKNRKNGISVTCKPCAINRSGLWEKNNSERVLQNSRNLYHKDIEKSRENRRKRVQKWKKANPGKSEAATKDWLLRNPDYRRMAENKRRSAKIGNGVFEISKYDILKILENSCVACGSSSKITLDHVIPISRGGRHSIGNLQPLCSSCNSSKGSKTMMEWKIFKGEKNGTFC